MKKLLLGTALLVGSCLNAVGQSAAPASDTTQWPAAYATALPSLVYEQWDKDYARYQRFLTKEIAQTQAGMSFTHDGVTTWMCTPAAHPHAQLDTTTRVADPARLTGQWRSLVTRAVIHRDSAVMGEKKIYRSVRVVPVPGQAEVEVADGKFGLFTRESPTAKLKKEGRKKYELVNGRYLLLYGASKAGGAVSQVGLDAQGRLIVHTCSVVERKVSGRYITFITAIQQGIFERQ